MADRREKDARSPDDNRWFQYMILPASRHPQGCSATKLANRSGISHLESTIRTVYRKLGRFVQRLTVRRLGHRKKSLSSARSDDSTVPERRSESTTVVIIPPIALLLQFGRGSRTKPTARYSSMWTGDAAPPKSHLLLISANDAWSRLSLSSMIATTQS